MSQNHELFRCVPMKHNLTQEEKNRCRPMNLQSDKVACEDTGVCVYQGEYGGCRPTGDEKNAFCTQVRTQTSPALINNPDNDVRDICNMLSRGRCIHITPDA